MLPSPPPKSSWALPTFDMPFALRFREPLPKTSTCYIILPSNHSSFFKAEKDHERKIYRIIKYKNKTLKYSKNKFTNASFPKTKLCT